MKLARTIGAGVIVAMTAAYVAGEPTTAPTSRPAPPASRPTSKPAADDAPTIEAALRRMPSNVRHTGPGKWTTMEKVNAGGWLHDRLMLQPLSVTTKQHWYEGGPDHRVTLTVPPLQLWGMRWRGEVVCMLTPEVDAFVAAQTKDARLRFDGTVASISTPRDGDDLVVKVKLQDVTAKVSK